MVVAQFTAQLKPVRKKSFAILLNNYSQETEKKMCKYRKRGKEWSIY